MLASSSPRRREILGKFISNFEVKSSDIEEFMRDGESPIATVMANAYRKAEDIASREDAGIVIGADTVVYMNKILGKPSDLNEAREMLRTLSGRTHQVITGIVIVDVSSNAVISDYDITEVKFRELDDGMIYRYLDMEEYRDKAGSYAIQERGEILVEYISGSYSNVVGLPILKLEKCMNHFNSILL